MLDFLIGMRSGLSALSLYPPIRHLRLRTDFWGWRLTQGLGGLAMDQVNVDSALILSCVTLGNSLPFSMPQSSHM